MAYMFRIYPHFPLCNVNFITRNMPKDEFISFRYLFIYIESELK